MFSASSSPVVLIRRKVAQDKRVETDFRHLNVRIAKNNLAYPIHKDTFLAVVVSVLLCQALLKMDLRYPKRNVSYLGQNSNIWVTQFL